MTFDLDLETRPSIIVNYLIDATARAALPWLAEHETNPALDAARWQESSISMECR